MRFEVKDVVCDYGVYEDGKLIPQLIFSSRQNALKVAEILNNEYRHQPYTYCFTVYDVLVLTEFTGKIVDFGYNEIIVTDDNRDEIYALSVNCVYAENDKIVIHTFLNEREVIENELV